MNILTVDVGTQSLKVSIYNEALECLERFRAHYQPTTHSGNCVEIEAEVFWDAFVSVCGQLTTKTIDGIVFSTLCPSLLLMDKSGRPLVPVLLHLDRRSQKQSSWIADAIGTDRFRSITGNPPIPGGISITSMLWVKEHFDNQIPDGAVFGHVVTYFMKRLTGRFAIDPSNASFTGLYETVGYSDWSQELLEKTGIERTQLPEVLDCLSVAGSLLPEAARETGLTAGVPVIIGANDTTCAVVGAGIRESGMLLNTCGTVEILALCADRPIVGPNHLLRTHAYRDRWLLMRTLGAGGASIEWFRRNFCRDLTYEEFYSTYLDTVLGRSEDVEVTFSPYLTGDRHRVEPLRASFSDFTIDSTREDFLYALSHDNIKFLISILPEWRESCSLSRDIYHVGGCASEAYKRLKQEMLSDYRFINMGETAERGAAVIGFETLGMGPFVGPPQ